AAVFGVDFARIQRAGKGAEHSTAQRRNHVVDGGRVRLGQPAFVNAVMFGDTAVDAEHHGLRFSRQMRPAQRAFDALDAHVGGVGNFGHGGLLYRPAITPFSTGCTSCSGLAKLACAMRTCCLKSSIMPSCRRTSVGFRAMVILSILSCKRSNP